MECRYAKACAPAACAQAFAGGFLRTRPGWGGGLQQGVRGRQTMLRRAWREAFCGTTSEEKHMTRPDSLLDSSFDLFVIGGGSGGVRARVEKSGIEEIDLVSEELARTGERMAGRLAAERQFAADASHQLRTPLTALSMRLEEIEYLSDREDVREEAASCLEQVERLAGVVAELLSTSQSAGVGTEAVPLRKLFDQQRDEWERSFLASARPPVFRVVLSAVPRSLDPDKILPAGSIISMGSRRRRR